MTLLMVWRERSLDRLWIVGDSRLTRPGASDGHVRLTDRAAKVMEADVFLRGLDPRAPPTKSRKVGLAYAGSSLVALQSYVAALPLWTRLMSFERQELPTMGDLAEHLGRFVRAYTFDLAAAGDFGCQTECILLGPDDLSGRVEAWGISTRPSATGVDFSCEEVQLGPGAMVLHGSGKADAVERLRELKPADGQWHREPLDMIRKHLRDDAPGTVGGGVQIGVANRDGFVLYADAQAFRPGFSRPGDPLLAISYRGFDLGDVSRVGHAFVSFAGISG
jgi:hypothetical protein